MHLGQLCTSTGLHLHRYLIPRYLGIQPTALATDREGEGTAGIPPSSERQGQHTQITQLAYVREGEESPCVPQDARGGGGAL